MLAVPFFTITDLPLYFCRFFSGPLDFMNPTGVLIDVQPCCVSQKAIVIANFLSSNYRISIKYNHPCQSFTRITSHVEPCWHERTPVQQSSFVPALKAWSSAVVAFWIEGDNVPVLLHGTSIDRIWERPLIFQWGPDRHSPTTLPSLLRIYTAMANSFRSFTLALIQLGKIGSNKGDNLKHAREMILKAASVSEAGKQPDVIVLPVRTSTCYWIVVLSPLTFTPKKRNVSTPRMDTNTSQSTQRKSDMFPGGNSIPHRARAKVSRCCHRSPVKWRLGLSEVRKKKGYP